MELPTTPLEHSDAASEPVSPPYPKPGPPLPLLVASLPASGLSTSYFLLFFTPPSPLNSSPRKPSAILDFGYCLLRMNVGAET